jgi:hypothetical protein
MTSRKYLNFVCWDTDLHEKRRLTFSRRASFVGSSAMISSKVGQAKIAMDGPPGPEDAGRAVFRGATATPSPPKKPDSLRLADLGRTPSGVRPFFINVIPVCAPQYAISLGA